MCVTVLVVMIVLCVFVCTLILCTSFCVCVCTVQEFLTECFKVFLELVLSGSFPKDWNAMIMMLNLYVSLSLSLSPCLTRMSRRN